MENNLSQYVLQFLQGTEPPLVIRMGNSSILLYLDNIKRLEGDNTSTTFHLHYGKELKLTGCIGQYYKLLEPSGKFGRCHKSHVVCLRCVVQVFDCGELLMLDGKILPIGKQYNEEFRAKLPGTTE